MNLLPWVLARFEICVTFVLDMLTRLALRAPSLVPRVSYFTANLLVLGSPPHDNLLIFGTYTNHSFGCGTRVAKISANHSQ